MKGACREDEKKLIFHPGRIFFGPFRVGKRGEAGKGSELMSV
jgi:hypothetical protein